ncbi:MAG: hypothetical protein R3208_01910 [Ketobacteraceae bacterium]|nr:hypothetical protein [Ketobacteraceae bacterium]
MKLAVTYTTIPAYGELTSLHFQYDQLRSVHARLWVHVPGRGSARPWWLDYGEQASEPEYLNEQTTRIISNLVQGMRLEAVPDFAGGEQEEADESEQAGEIKELEFLAGYNRVKYVWWKSLPSQWQDFSPLLAFFDGFIEARQP